MLVDSGEGPEEKSDENMDEDDEDYEPKPYDTWKGLSSGLGSDDDTTGQSQTLKSGEIIGFLETMVKFVKNDD